jgi:hypothetical protein
MEQGFEIKVPITLKGGNEGEKVGRQIGEKIAAQMNKSLKVIGLGEKGKTEIGGIAGFSKGIKGLAVKMGLIGAAITAAVGLLAESSPYLKGILSIMGRAFGIFFRPFGDFLATILRPLAILMMRMAIAFLKWTRPINKEVSKAMENAPQIPTTGKFYLDGPIEIANLGLKLGSLIEMIWIKGAGDIAKKIGDWFYFSIIVPVADYLTTKILDIWNWVTDFPGWLWEKITSIWSWVKDFPGWIWTQITSIWNWAKNDFAGWVWEKITSIWNWNWDFGAWLWGKVKSIWNWVSGGKPDGEGQTGISNVPNDGMYKLHRGEQVLTRNQQNSKSVVLRPTFNFNGNISQSIDMDEIARRGSIVIERELKQRGVI